MADLIEKIKARSLNIKKQREKFVSKLVELNDTLSESLNGIDVWARSSKEILEMTGPDDWVYGYLSFSEGELEIVYRSTEEDLIDTINKVSEEHRSYKTKSIKSCSIGWLESLSTEEHVSRLLSNIDKSLESIEDDSISSIKSLNEALDSQSEEISNEAIEALREAGSDELIGHWLKARSSIHSDPADSITRSSSYLESVCRLILVEVKEPLPNKIDITNLINAAVKALDLSDNAEANRDLKQLFGGIKSIFQSVGSMRTHFGTAHGFAPGDYLPSEHYARLINDASATASTYLLRRLKQKINKSLPTAY